MASILFHRDSHPYVNAVVQIATLLVQRLL